MPVAPRILINTPEIELWPGGLLRARSNRDARVLARARHVLRRKRDGKYLAADLPEGLLPLVQRLTHEPGIDEALDALDSIPVQRRGGLDVIGELPLHRLLDRLALLGLDESYGDGCGLELIAEPATLAFAGFDRYSRPLWLHPHASRAWLHMRESAHRDGIVLEAISGYRSHDYQLG
ncbi:MAG: D-alanyl-D-alanine carboxypeptidase family protein, partial [Pseudomonadota bacterium]|nr:D-alanyl-D-alanine carboxypeptidase family protein [Pseudomonadota bacterium]